MIFFLFSSECHDRVLLLGMGGSKIFVAPVLCAILPVQNRIDPDAPVAMVGTKRINFQTYITDSFQLDGEMLHNRLSTIFVLVDDTTFPKQVVTFKDSKTATARSTNRFSESLNSNAALQCPIETFRQSQDDTARGMCLDDCSGYDTVHPYVGELAHLKATPSHKASLYGHVS